MNYFKLHKESADKRTTLIYKNIAGSFIIKAWTGVVQLLLVPMTLRCLNQYEYGIWLTISSFLLWIDTFDIGLGNGLRNKLAESIATNNYERGRQQVSTTFCMLFMIVLPIVAILLVIIHNIDCYKLLNVNPHSISHLDHVLMCSLAFVSANFIFKFIGNIYLALQLPAINNLLIAIGHTIVLISLYFLSMWEEVSLMHVAIAYTASPLLIYLISYPITFSKYKEFRPALSYFNIHELKPLLVLGIKFFLAQFSNLIIFASSNILISHIFSPKDVTPYQIAYRYFGITNIAFTIISVPFWSATTEAYTKGDWSWISKSIRKLRMVLVGFFLVLCFMLLLANPVYCLWVGNSIIVPFELSMAIMLYTGVILYSTCYSNMLCGIGKIYLLTSLTVLEAILYIPLAIFLACNYGCIGIVIALIAVNIPSALINKLQFDKLCKNKAYGIWNK